MGRIKRGYKVEVMKPVRIQTLRISDRQVGLPGAEANVFAVRVRFENSRTKQGLKAVVKRFRHQMGDREAYGRLQTYALLEKLAIPLVKSTLVKILRQADGSYQVLHPSKDAQDWSRGEWVEVAQAYTRHGKSILEKITEKNKVPEQHAPAYLKIVARLANAGLLPARDAIHALKGIKSGRYMLSDRGGVLPGEEQSIAALLVNHLELVDSDNKSKWMVHLHDNLENDNVKTALRLSVMKKIKKK